jgi:hypothetical protein|nr:FimB/Mfa2 family fimbrial subunit [Alistipes onderdonkii]
MKFCSIKYFRLFGAVILSWGLMCGCTFKDSYEDCGLYLHFSYHYNMAYADAAFREVNRIDVLVFDAQGTYLFMKSANAEELTRNNYRISFSELSEGNYTFLAWGGLSEDFRLSGLDARSLEFVPGKTRVEDIYLDLHAAEDGVCRKQLHPLWYAEPLNISYNPRSGRNIHTVSLIKNTNHFHFSLQEEGTPSSGAVGELLPYTFEIISIGYERYDWKNTPVGTQRIATVCYEIETDDFANTSAQLVTGRLLEEKESRILYVRSTRNTNLLWKFDLGELLSRTCPDGMSLQEYLDRQDTWSLIFNYKGDGIESFIAVSVSINGWTLWLQDVEA